MMIGFASSIFSGCLSVQFMKHVDKEYLARVGSIFNAAACAATPVTSFLISTFLGIFSTAQMLIVGGGICVMIFVVIGIRKVRFE